MGTFPWQGGENILSRRFSTGCHSFHSFPDRSRVNYVYINRQKQKFPSVSHRRYVFNFTSCYLSYRNKRWRHNTNNLHETMISLLQRCMGPRVAVRFSLFVFRFLYYISFFHHSYCSVKYNNCTDVINKLYIWKLWDYLIRLFRYGFVKNAPITRSLYDEDSVSLYCVVSHNYELLMWIKILWCRNRARK